MTGSAAQLCIPPEPLVSLGELGELFEEGRQRPPPAQPTSCREGGALHRRREMQIIHDFYKKFRKAFRVPGMTTEMLPAELQVQQRSRNFMREKMSVLPLLLHPRTPLRVVVCLAAHSYPVLPTPLHLPGSDFAQANASWLCSDT